MRLTHVDLFSGIGGFSLAARWAGIETIQFIEYHGPTDTHGRCHFSLRWIDDYFPGHPEGEHVRRERGQHFHADPRKYGHLRPDDKEDSDD